VKPPAERFVLDDSLCVYGAKILLKHLKSLTAEINEVRARNEDIEYVHRARVASRRLRAALPLFQECFPAKKSKRWRKEIRKITRALGEARDTDVQLVRLREFYACLSEARHKTGIRRLILRLEQKRALLQEPVTGAAHRLEKSGVIEEMEKYFRPLGEQSKDPPQGSAALYQLSARSIQDRLGKFLAFDSITNQPEKIEELHQMRIAAKRLRYTMEVFAPLYNNRMKPHLSAVKEAQEILGEIHDCDVWAEALPRFIEEERQRTIEYLGSAKPMSRIIPGIQLLIEDRHKARWEQYQIFQEKWLAWKQEGLWDDLSRIAAA